MVWQQIYNPLGNMVLSTLLAALPVVVMLVGAAQHAFEERFGDDLAEARQYLMQAPVGAGEAADAAA